MIQKITPTSPIPKRKGGNERMGTGSDEMPQCKIHHEPMYKINGKWICTRCGTGQKPKEQKPTFKEWDKDTFK